MTTEISSAQPFVPHSSVRPGTTAGLTATCHILSIPLLPCRLTARLLVTLPRVQTSFQLYLFLLIPFLFVATRGTIAAAPAEQHLVPPGSVVRWPGESLESCGLAGRQWSPIGGACWYPVDLLATGSLELERRRAGRPERRAVRVGDYPYDVQRINIEDDSRVNLSPENLERAGRESARIGALWSRENDIRFDLPLSPPLAELPSGGRFGARRIINDQPKNPHTGVDYAADEGEPVLAVAAGSVVLAEDHFFAGNSVFIDHGAGLISMYFHLSSIAVHSGEQVVPGQLIGEVGSTGRATGPHLHFGLRWHGSRIDPDELLGAPASVATLE